MWVGRFRLQLSHRKDHMHCLSISLQVVWAAGITLESILHRKKGEIVWGKQGSIVRQNHIRNAKSRKHTPDGGDDIEDHCRRQLQNLQEGRVVIDHKQVATSVELEEVGFHSLPRPAQCCSTYQVHALLTSC